MHRFHRVLVGLSGLLFSSSLVVAAVGSASGPGPVYSLQAVQGGLARDPHAWLGQSVEVRALAEPCPWWGELARRQHCGDRLLVLVGMPTEAPVAPLPLVRLAPLHLWSFLGRLPILSNLLPRPHTVPLFVLARFHVRLLALPSEACAGRLRCYEALLDTMPGAP